MRRMRRIMENATDGRLVFIGCLAGDLPAGVAVAVEAREVAAGDLQADAMARQEHIRCGTEDILEPAGYGVLPVCRM
jgi:hypothetical protein